MSKKTLLSSHNIPFIYVLSFLRSPWFWMGIWVLYYLRFTNYAGIGVLETVMILTITLAEIPTGAIADLFGKRKTLVIAFILMGLGNGFMGLSQQFFHLLVSVTVACIGVALASGSLEAIAYDSLKQDQKESTFDVVASRMSGLEFAAPALCGILGGFLYAKNPSLPFLMTGLFYLFGAAVALFLIEPKTDTEKFSLPAFLSQTKHGFLELFSSRAMRSLTIFLISIGAFVVMNAEAIDAIISVDIGFRAEDLGILWGVIYLAAAGVGQLVPVLRKHFSDTMATYLVGLVYVISAGVTLLFLHTSQQTLMIVGALMLFARASIQTVVTSLAGVQINARVQAKYRATALSTYSMLKSLPYALTAVLIGFFADRWGSIYVGALLGFLCFVIMTWAFVGVRREKGLF
jgi:MFS family permease